MGTAVLAGVVVTLEDVPTAEGHVSCRQPVVMRQRNDLRHAQPQPDTADEGFARLGSELGPVLPGVELEVLRIDNARRLVPQQHQRPGHRGHVHRLPVAVEDQRRTLEHLGHGQILYTEGVWPESNRRPLVHSQACSHRYTTDTT